MSKLHVRRGDTVVVLSGKNKGKKGKVLVVHPKKNEKDQDTVIVEGVNIVTKHKKPRSAQEPGGIIKQESPINICKVMVICTKCGAPSRMGRSVLDNGEIVRVCKKCEDQI